MINYYWYKPRYTNHLRDSALSFVVTSDLLPEGRPCKIKLFSGDKAKWNSLAGDDRGLADRNELTQLSDIETILLNLEE